MKRRTGKSLFLLCNLYVSAVVGAGFATGQEIMGFFTRYGPEGFFGILLAGAAFMILGPLILQKAVSCDAYTPGELASFRFGKKGEYGMRTVNLFLEFSVLVVLLSGMRTVLRHAGVSNQVAIAVLTIGLFIIVSSDLKRVLQFNAVMTPVVIFGITATCLLLLFRYTSWSDLNVIMNQSFWYDTKNAAAYPWLLSAVLYAGFNLLLAMPALCLGGKILRDQNPSIGGSVLGGACIGGMALLTNLLLFANASRTFSAQMPVVELVIVAIPWFGVLYQVILFFAMAGSAVICASCAIDLFSGGKTERSLLRSALICGLAGPLSMMNFSGLISVLYPFFGGLGILAVLLILW